MTSGGSAGQAAAWRSSAPCPIRRFQPCPYIRLDQITEAASKAGAVALSHCFTRLASPRAPSPGTSGCGRSDHRGWMSRHQAAWPVSHSTSWATPTPTRMLVHPRRRGELAVIQGRAPGSSFGSESDRPGFWVPQQRRRRCSRAVHPAGHPPDDNHRQQGVGSRSQESPSPPETIPRTR